MHDTISPSDLTKLTVNLTSRAMEAVNVTAKLLGDTRTGTINRSVQIYAAAVSLDQGERIRFDRTDGERVTLRRVDGTGRRTLAFGLVLIVLAFAAGVASPW